MSITVETGSGNAAANSYASVEQADAWHAARGITTWADLLTEEREQALVRATAYMQQVYRLRWAGSRVLMTQALDWPRAWVPMVDAPGYYGAYPAYYPSNAVPREVRDACCELALTAAAGDLSPNIERQAKSVTVGPITKVYADNASPVTRYRAIDNMLAPLLLGASVGDGSSIKLVRA